MIDPEAMYEAETGCKARKPSTSYYWARSHDTHLTKDYVEWLEKKMDTAERIVKAIEDDFTDRRGLRQEWEQIDADIQAEIRETWTRLVREELEKSER